MKNYLDYNYKYVVTKDMVVAISSYAGRTVRGVAKCHPKDTFDVEYGKKLAAARCNYKIALKRNKSAIKKYSTTLAAKYKAERDFHKACEFVTDANDAINVAVKNLSELSKV